MDDFKQFLSKFNTKDAALLDLVHKKILSLSTNVQYLIFPIYIRYTTKDKMIAVLYFKKNNFLDLGLNIDKNKITPRFKSAEYMKYPEIKYSIKIEKKGDIKFIKL